MIAALYVHRGGAYYGLPDVDPWDEARDARKYSGPWPVVAHPPCSRWCQMAAVNQKRWGAVIGDDGGCFAAALDSVRRFGGVLEHPAYSLAWPRFGIARPTADGQWARSPCGGWVAQVSQRNYGHPARKRTWLYAVGCELPELIPGDGPPPAAWCGNDALAVNPRPTLSKHAAIATPPAFRELLLGMARSVSDRF